MRTVKNKYFNKDLAKFKICNKLISRGVPDSSSHLYSSYVIANKGHYVSTDIVGVSVNGLRFGRLTFNRDEIDLAIAVRASFVLDNDFDAERLYNIGEREIRSYLESQGYKKDYNSEFRSFWVIDEI